jgi:peptide/nickel transport system permease protein
VGALIGRRLLALIPILLLVSFATFMLVALFPGDAALTLAGGQNARPQDVARIQRELHLDEPVLEQYGHWLGNAVQLDLGRSVFSHAPVINEIGDRLPVTLSIVVAAMFVGLLLGIPLGLAAGLRPSGPIDHSSRAAASVGLAVPSFWLAVELIALFAVARRWFPPSGWIRVEDDFSGWLDHVAMPAVALGVASAASIARQLRAELIDVLDTNYVRTAWAKGGRARLVVAKHALKNASIPAVTVIGLQAGFLLGGTVVVEQIFGIPGLGTYFTTGALAQDIPVIQGSVLVFAIAQVVISLLVDITYGLLNPKVRVQ